MARSDPRGNARRGASPFGDETGYDVANDAPAKNTKRWPAPSDIYAINRLVRQRAATGKCVVCGQPADSGATCKAPNCVRCWVLGKDEPFTTVHEAMEY